MAIRIASITGSGATASPSVFGWRSDELSATHVTRAEAAGVLVQQQASLSLGVGGRQSFVEPANFLVAAELKLPTKADAPTLKHFAVPLRIERDKIAGGNSILLVENWGFVAWREEAT